MTEKKRPGRPSLGPRHTVALMLPPADWAKLQEVSTVFGVKPGPYSTRLVIEHLRSLDLAAIREDSSK